MLEESGVEMSIGDRFKLCLAIIVVVISNIYLIFRRSRKILTSNFSKK